MPTEAQWQGFLEVLVPGADHQERVWAALSGVWGPDAVVWSGVLYPASGTTFATAVTTQRAWSVRLRLAADRAWVGSVVLGQALPPRYHADQLVARASVAIAGRGLPPPLLFPAACGAADSVPS